MSERLSDERIKRIAEISSKGEWRVLTLADEALARGAERDTYKTALRALFDEIDSDPPDPHRVAQFTAAYEAARRLLFPGEAPAKGEQTEMDWQPIESAPKDGTEVLVYWPYWSARPLVAWYCGDVGGWDSDRCLAPTHAEASPERQPTHWMPLPPSPPGGR